MKPPEGSTVIGKSVTIRGELSGKEDLYMDGTIEGTITLSDSRLTIGPNARVQADLDARDVVIHGRVDGKVRATGRIRGCVGSRQCAETSSPSSSPSRRMPPSRVVWN